MLQTTWARCQTLDDVEVHYLPTYNPLILELITRRCYIRRGTVSKSHPGVSVYLKKSRSSTSWEGFEVPSPHRDKAAVWFGPVTD